MGNIFVRLKYKRSRLAIVRRKNNSFRIIETVGYLSGPRGHYKTNTKMLAIILATFGPRHTCRAYMSFLFAAPCQPFSRTSLIYRDVYPPVRHKLSRRKLTRVSQGDFWRIFITSPPPQRGDDKKRSRPHCTYYAAPEDRGFLVHAPSQVRNGLTPEALRDSGHVCCVCICIE